MRNFLEYKNGWMDVDDMICMTIEANTISLLTFYWKTLIDFKKLFTSTIYQAQSNYIFTCFGFN